MRFAAVLAAALLLAPAAAAGVLDTAAEHLRSDPVYVDPAARDLLPAAGQRRVERAIGSGDAGPVYVVVLPARAAAEAGGDPTEALRTIAESLQRRGTYVGVVGDHLRALSNVLPRGEAGRLATAALEAHRRDGVAAVVDLVDRIAGARSGGGDGGGAGSGLWVVVAIAGAIVLLLVLRSRRRRSSQLDAVRAVARDDLVALAEDVQELEDRVASSPRARAAYDRAVDAYGRASGAFDRARTPQQLQSVAQALEEGRYEMAVAEAELEGRRAPERRPPCFFDPRHGPSVRDVEWAAPGGMPRAVPACEADAQRVERGKEPQSRQVLADGQLVPYWAAPAYGGYFGGFLPGLLLGQMLMPWGYDLGEPAGPADDSGGGDFGGVDFGGGDFGGGDFGGGGGGDF